jgi:hypothetical protein
MSYFINMQAEPKHLIDINKQRIKSGEGKYSTHSDNEVIKAILPVRTVHNDLAIDGF